jgi:hypothetical protein
MTALTIPTLATAGLVIQLMLTTSMKTPRTIGNHFTPMKVLKALPKSTVFGMI